MSDLWFKPAHELASLIRSKQLSPVELLEACLKRIEETNPVLNAFIAMKPDEAMAEARNIESRIAKGEDVGPLAGLPFGVKELENVAGYPSTHASVPYKDNYPESDSTQVQRLKKAGAIVLGKTNAPEFGYTAFSKNLLFGVTRNPWNPERTPGGSSGGSSAAVTAGQVPFCTGSDGGGSIRIPACWAGCFGHKPSNGRVPKGPFQMMGWNDTSVYGPLTRTVRDAALYLDAVVGTAENEPDSLPHPGYSYAEILDKLPKKLRIAWSPDMGYAAVQPDVLREAAAAARAFQEMGHEVEEVDRVADDTGTIWAQVSSAEVYAHICDKIETHRDEFGRAFLRGVLMAANVTPDKFGQAQRVRARLVNQLAEFFEKYDLLLTPTLPLEAIDARGKWPDMIAGKPVTNPLHVVAFTYPFNLSGHPAASVRAGFTDNGLPVGLHIVGRRHRDDTVLQAAHAFEQARPWNDRWPVEVPAFAG